MNYLIIIIGLPIILAVGIAIGLVQQQDARGISIRVLGHDANGANGGNANGANGTGANGANGTSANGANGISTHGANGINGDACGNSGGFVN